MSEYSEAADGSAIFVQDGIGYRLGLIPTPPERRALCAATPIPTVPESEWRTVDRRELFVANDSMLNQKSCNGCVGFSTASGLEKLRFLHGQPWLRLSGPYVYSLINGGRDQGAMIADALGAVLHYGACTEASLPLDSSYDNIYRSRSKPHDAEAQRFKLEKGFRVDSAEEAASVILKGGILEFGVKVGRNFGPQGSEGVSGFDGGYANHAVHADGLVKTNSHGWCLDLDNTWGRGWGRNGRVLWPLDYLEKTGYQEMFGMLGVIDDPGDAQTPPTPAE